MEQQMKKIGRQMSLCMGITLSLCLSLVGTIHGTRNAPQGFTVPQWLSSFAVSLVISLIIGFIVPMGKVGRAVTRNMAPGSIKARLMESLVSNLIYTPLITLIMVTINWRGAKRAAEAAALAQGAPAEVARNAGPGFLATFLPGLCLCFIVGWVIIFIVQPLFMKWLMKRSGQGVNEHGGNTTASR